MTLNLMKAVKFIFSLSLYAGFTFSASANDFELKGAISIGSKTSEISPIYMLEAKPTKKNKPLDTPKPKHPIHFNLTKKFTLSKIELQNSNNAKNGLYFVVWDSNGKVLLNKYSKDEEKIELNKGIKLAPGDYQIAIVGQCLEKKNKKWKSAGWHNECNSKDKKYDSFSFKDIKLGDGESDSLAFIQRRHIGDNNDTPKDGYDDRWYPDMNEGTEVTYDFTVEDGAKLTRLTMYNYRDFSVGQGEITFTLTPEKGSSEKHPMNSSTNSGDYTWNFDSPLSSGDYELKIKTHRVWSIFGPDRDFISDWLSYSADDISWDDIVIAPEGDTPPTPSVNHYRIIHPDHALTCESASVTIKACSNSGSGGTCVVSTDVNADITLMSSGVPKLVKLTGGVGATDLATLSPTTLELKIDSTIPTYCGPTTTSSTCNIEFINVGLQFSTDINNNMNIGNQIAAVEINSLYLRALQSDGNGTCEELKLPNSSFNLGVECLSPRVCDNNLDFMVTDTDTAIATELDNDGGKTPVSLSKVVNEIGVYKIAQPVYDNAGSIRLSASYKFNNDVMLYADSNDFSVRPYQFNIVATGGSSVDLTQKTNSEFSYTHVAGDEFEFKVKAVNSNGVVTANYTPSSVDSLKVKLTRTIPDVDGADGKFVYANNTELSTALVGTWQDGSNLTVFKNGVSTFPQANYNEVGAFAINIKDADYYGMTFSVDDNAGGDSQGQEVGRFIPSHFELVSSKVDNYVGARRSFHGGYDYVFPNGLSSYSAGTTVLQPKDNNVYQCREYPNSGYCVQWSEGSNQYEPGIGSAWEMAWILLDSPDSGAVFTYMDQPELRFDYRIEAQNSLGAITYNYDGDLNADVTFSAEVDGVRNISFSERLRDFGGIWQDGVYEPESMLDEGNFARLARGPDGPLSHTLFGISIADNDNVLFNDTGTDMSAGEGLLAAKALSEQVSELRYGRWFIYDGSGPTGSAFPVTMELQYYDPNKATGDGFIINIDDSKTPFDGDDATTNLGSLTDDSGIFKSGSSSDLMISSDSPGTAILEYINTPEWLMPADGDEPSANITFGFFYGNDRVIYRRRLN